MRVLLVDDHAMFRDGISMLLQSMLQGLCIHESASCEEALECLKALSASQRHDDARDPLKSPPVDLVLMDLAMPGECGLAGVAWIRQHHPAIPVVVLSSADDRDTVMRALDAGAMGFVPKSSGSLQMREALRVVMAQGIYLPEHVLSSPSARPIGLGPASEPGAALSTVSAVEAMGLTPRQAQVLDLILQGLPTKLICRELEVSMGTAKSHISAVLRALNVTTRTQAVVVAGRLGWRVGAGHAAPLCDAGTQVAHGRSVNASMV